MLNYIKTLRHVSISTDHHQGVCTLFTLLNYLKKNTEFKILKISSGVVDAKRVAGIRGDPYGAVRNAQHHTGHHVYLLHVLHPQHRNWSSGF